jgi:hypothetical protein
VRVLFYQSLCFCASTTKAAQKKKKKNSKNHTNDAISEYNTFDVIRAPKEEKECR